MNQSYDGVINNLIEFHKRVNLLPETLYLTVNIFRQFLSVEQAADYDDLLLIGVTPMFIAFKYKQEANPISIADFCYIANCTFTKEEIIQKEFEILNIFQDDLSYPNPIQFLERLLKEANADERTCKLSHYSMEISLVDNQLSLFPSSYLADSAFYFAQRIQGYS